MIRLCTGFTFQSQDSSCCVKATDSVTLKPSQIVMRLLQHTYPLLPGQGAASPVPSQQPAWSDMQALG